MEVIYRLLEIYGIKKPKNDDVLSDEYFQQHGGYQSYHASFYQQPPPWNTPSLNQPQQPSSYALLPHSSEPITRTQTYNPQTGQWI